MTPETLALRELLDARRDEFQVLLDRYGATSPKLFGSVARGTAHPGSDIDILVEMDPGSSTATHRDGVAGCCSRGRRCQRTAGPSA